VYDANVEPAKDDVLFDNSKALEIIALVEDLFKSVYGDLPAVAKEHSKRHKVREQDTTQSDDFNVLLAHRKEEPSSGEQNQELLSGMALLSPPLPPMRMPDSDPVPPLDITTGQHNDKSPFVTRGNVVQHDTQAVQDPVNKDSTNPNHVITPVPDLSSNRQTTSNILSSPCNSSERPPHSAQRPTANSDVDIHDVPVSAASSSPLRLQNAPIYPSPTAAVTPNNSSPCFNPINQSRGSRTSEGSSPLQPHALAVRRKRFGPPHGISAPAQQPLTPYTPPRLLEDPENAGAIERFLIRRPRSPDPAARPLQLDVTPDSIRRPIPLEMDYHVIHSLSPTNHLSGSKLSNHNLSAQMQTRQSPSQHTRPRGEEPFMQPLQPLLQPSPLDPTLGLVAPIAPMMGSSIYSQYPQSLSSAGISESSGALEAPRKRPRLNNNSPHKNRFLNATAELAQDATMEDSMRRSVPQPLPPSILRAGDELTEPREPMAPREPRASGGSVQGGNSAIQQEEPTAPKPHPQRRKSTRTQPAPPLLPYGNAWQTHRLVLSVNAATALRKPVRITEDFYDVDENTGTLVERWMEMMLGEALPRARDWDLVERQNDVATLRAVYEGYD
jgi:hypothetical protein